MIKKIDNQIFKALFLSIIIIMTACSSLAIINEDNTQILKLNYNFDSPSISSIELENTTFDKLILPNCYTAGNPGEPNIPSKGAYILLPPMSKIKNIQVEVKNKINLGFGYNIEPIGEAIPISDMKVTPKLVKDDFIYKLNDFYPGEIFSYVGVYSFRGYDILVILLHPIQYNPVTGELIYYKDLEVTVETSSDGYIDLFRGLEIDKIEVMKKVENPETAEMYSQKINSIPTINENYDLLILTTDSLKSGFEPLKNAHNAKGLSTVIKTLTDVGSSDPEDIRNYIIDAYSNWGINYVLLGGDHDIVPARILWVYGLDEETDPYETYLPSDIYYSCLNGPYNYDGDDKWGEPTDGADGEDVDLIADVYVGRACVDNINDVNNFVSKTITYINKDPEMEYLKKACFSGEYMGDYGIATWGGNYADQLIDVCSDDGYTTTGVPSTNYTIIKLYDRDWEGNDWPKEEMMNIINDGVHFISHLGHSYYEYNMKMYNEDIYDLNNTDYCFIYSQGCMAGGFDDDYSDCIAEYFTVKTDTGAFAGIWNARYGWFWSYSTDGDSQRFHREFWDAVFSENIPQIGKANSDSKEDNLAIINRSCIRWVYYETNLFGDPSLCFYEIEENDPPEIPDIDGPARHKVGVEYEYTFTSIDPDGDGLDYYIDWGDGNSTNWIGPYGSGEDLVLTHTWTEKGNYIIRAKVRDIPYGTESDWGEFIVRWQSKSISVTLFNLLERLSISFQRLLFIFGI